MNTIKNIIENLNILLEKNYAAEKGYKEAAKEIKEKSLEQFFLNQAKQRKSFSESLKDEIKALGKTPVQTTDFTSDSHRNWMKVKEFLSLNQDELMLEEVIRGEENALEAYNNILKDTEVSLTISETIQKQRNYIIETLEKLRSFELEVA